MYVYVYVCGGILKCLQSYFDLWADSHKKIIFAKISFPISPNDTIFCAYFFKEWNCFVAH